MVIIKHNRATLTVQPEHAEPTRELLALIDKSKGAKGRKFKKSTDPKHNSMSRFYPSFYAGMSTAEYLRRYVVLNAHVHLLPTDYTHADRPAPMLDPSIPEVEKTCEQ